MFKNETLVKWIVCGLLFSAATAMAEDKTESDRPGVAGGNCRGYSDAIAYISKQEADFRLANPSEPADSPKMKVFEELRRKNEEGLTKCILTSAPGGLNNACPNGAINKFNEKVGEMSASCRGMPEVPVGEPNGNISCGHAIARCDCPSTPTSSPSYAALACQNGPVGSSGGQSTPNGGRNLEAARVQFQYCPILAAADLEKEEKNLREAQKEARESERKIPELQQGVADAQSQMNEKIQQANEKMADAAKQRGQQRADYVNQQRDAMKQIAQQVTTLTEQIAKIEETRSQLLLQRQDAEIARQDGMANVRNNCHTQALNEVNKKQVEAMALGRNYIRGNFNQMLRNVGLSSRAAWQQQAKILYNECMKSDLTRSAIKSANSRYHALLDKANVAERDLDKRRAALQTQIGQLQNGNACSQAGTGTSASGTSTDTQACQAVRKMSEDIRRAEADYEAQRRLNSQALSNARRDGANRVRAKQQELASAERARFEDQARLANLRAFLELKQKYAPGGVSIDAKDALDTRSKHAQMVGAASVLTGCFDPEGCRENEACDKAARYLSVIGRTPIFGTASPEELKRRATKRAEAEKQRGQGTLIPPLSPVQQGSQGTPERDTGE